jgi:hypothetical protein
VLAGSTNVATGAHTHQVRVMFSDVDNRPPYREIVFAQRTEECC